MSCICLTLFYIVEAVVILDNINPEPKVVRSHPVKSKFTSLECPHARPDVSHLISSLRELALSSLTLYLLPFRDDYKIVSSTATHLEMKIEYFKETRITLN